MLMRPPSCISMLHSGHTNFLNTRSTFFFGQFSHHIFLQVGHCQSGGLKKPPISFPRFAQKPLTIVRRPRAMIVVWHFNAHAFHDVGLIDVGRSYRADPV